MYWLGVVVYDPTVPAPPYGEVLYPPLRGGTVSPPYRGVPCPPTTYAEVPYPPYREMS